MPAPFFVSAGDCAGPLEAPRDLPTIEAAIAAAREFRAKHPRAVVSIYGDGYDCDCDEDGFYMCNDGLDESERDAIEESGL